MRTPKAVAAADQTKRPKLASYAEHFERAAQEALVRLACHPACQGVCFGWDNVRACGDGTALSLYTQETSLARGEYDAAVRRACADAGAALASLRGLARDRGRARAAREALRLALAEAVLTLDNALYMAGFRLCENLLVMLKPVVGREADRRAIVVRYQKFVDRRDTALVAAQRESHAWLVAHALPSREHSQ